MTAPEEKQLRPFSFVMHVTRGLVRERLTRRIVMLVVILTAAAMLIAGTTIFAPFLKWGENPLLFLFYWFSCAWTTILALLLALFDILMVRFEARQGRAELRKRFSVSENTVMAPRDDKTK